MSSANTELKFDDDFVRTQAGKLAERASDLQQGIDTYINILNKISSDAIMEGTTAEALNSFIEYVENLKDIVKIMGDEAKGMCLAFLSEVDDKDSFLY
ncbi:MAG: hypothetical protein UH239_08860 [Acutalibacteraceae bacterium]|nr:hypothetical protein [Acutalibacteraceae bacterium]